MTAMITLEKSLITGFSQPQVAYVISALYKINKASVARTLALAYSKHLDNDKNAHYAVCYTLELAYTEYGVKY